MQISKKIILHKTVYFVEEHHHVLIPWMLERKNWKQPPHVLTLDHHTDTLPAFTHYDETHPAPHRKNYANASPEELESILPDLRHDEHFHFAVSNGIIASAVIFSHVNFSRDVDPRLTIIHHPPSSQDTAVLGNYYAQALEDDFLLGNLAEAPPPPSAPRILDIDLDYFKGEQSISPQKKSVFMELIRKSDVITISRERDWVRLLNMDYGNRQYEYFESRMIGLIREACL